MIVQWSARSFQHELLPAHAHDCETAFQIRTAVVFWPKSSRSLARRLRQGSELVMDQLDRALNKRVLANKFVLVGIVKCVVCVRACVLGNNCNASLRVYVEVNYPDFFFFSD